MPVLLPILGAFTVTAPAGTLQLLSIDQSLIDQEIRRWVRLPESGCEAPLGSLAPLRESIAAAAATAADDQAPQDRRRDTEAALVAAVLRTFGERAPLMVMPSTVELAEAFMETRYDRPTGLLDTAAAVGVSPRTLQTWFSADRGASPMTCLLLLRLERAHTALLAGDWRETTVSDIARRCGFLHMGRFSASYRRRFGEYPAQTLRDRWPATTDVVGARRIASVG